MSAQVQERKDESEETLGRETHLWPVPATPATQQGVVQRVVVLGAGYGGLTVARTLGRALRGHPDRRVVLVDRGAAHELKPRLPEAVGEWTDCTVQVPLADAVDERDVTVLQADVLGLDQATRRVLTDQGAVPYWRLVVALGAQSDPAPGGAAIPGLVEHAIAAYGQGPACRLRHQVGGLVAEAATLATNEARQPLLTVVVAGGGFVGVEMAGELADRLALLKRRHGIPDGEGRVVLLEPRSSLLGLVPDLDAAALTALREHGVDVRLGVGLTEVEPERVRLSDGSWLAARTVVWAGGTRGAAAIDRLGLPIDAHGRIYVNASLRVVGVPDVYAIGDGAHCQALHDRPDLVGSGQAAAQQGRFVAQAILAETRGRSVLPYRPRHQGTVVLVGHRDGVARIGTWLTPRWLAPWLKQLATIEHLWNIGGPRLVLRTWRNTLLPLVAPGRVDRYTLAKDAPGAH